MITRLGSACLLLSSLAGLAPAADVAPALPAGSATTREVATTAGIASWPQVHRLRFTWRHVPKDTARTYDWDVVAGTVAVTAGGTTVSVSTTTAPAAADEAAVAAHKSFVNDQYWLLFALHLGWDSVTAVDLGEVEVPQLPALGKRRALQVTYPAAGGYTPGDRYVVYLGDDRLPVAWAFHHAAAETPTLVTTWERYVTVGGLHLPTLFQTPDGKPFITIEALSVE